MPAINPGIMQKIIITIGFLLVIISYSLKDRGNKAAQLYNVELSKSYIIGDHLSDVECGIKAGVIPVYLLSAHGNKYKRELLFNLKICKNLSDASKYILSTMN
ncbi:MAG: hypothetical protein PVF73_04275 [Bacteroidales bacterium]